MAKSIYGKDWIIKNALPVIERYEKGILTIRGLHYQLVGLGMTNDKKHYDKVVNNMIQARWEGLVDFDAFVDNDRETIGYTDSRETVFEDKVAEGKRQVHLWMTNYSKNRWENQVFYPEIFIEKKALQGTFLPPCDKWNVALNPCKGYPSLTFLNDAAWRFKIAQRYDKIPIILYFGDYDPSGEDIPRSIEANLKKLGVDAIQLKRYALMEEQVIEWNLPPAPIKPGDARSKNWDGLGQVELDAIEPRKLQLMCADAIIEHFDQDLYEDLMDQEGEERVEYKIQLKEYVEGL